MITRFPPIFVRTYALDAVATWEVDFPVSSYAVLYYDGTAGLVKMRSTKEASDPNEIDVIGAAGDSWQEAGKKYIVNTAAQAGCTLIVKWGGPGTTVTVPGSLMFGDATAANQTLIKLAVEAAEDDVEVVAARLANQASVSFREITVTALEAQLPDIAVPHGHKLHLRGGFGNDDGNPILLHLTGEGASANVFKLYARDSLSLGITNANILYTTCGVGTNTLLVAVEKAV